jgi:hypothetical protein
MRLEHRDHVYHVDLCQPHIGKLDKVLAEFLAVARQGHA